MLIGFCGWPLLRDIDLTSLGDIFSTSVEINILGVRSDESLEREFKYLI